MLKVDRKYVDSIHDAIEILNQKNDTGTAKHTLIETLHVAMRLEASTIPPYYVAAWSVQDADGYQNALIRSLISEVSKEEMLHMMSVANIISASGERPVIATKEIVLDWGTDTLPVGGDIVPSLSPFSMELLTNLFMEIEKPVDPVHYVVLEESLLRSSDVHYATIGEFYEALIALIRTFPVDPFINGGDFQQIDVSNDRRFTHIDHAPITDFIVKDSDKAIELLQWIVDQGEGTTEGPMDGNGVPAHYYRFAEIYKGGKLVPAPNEPLKYAYDRARFPINCDFSKIFQFEPNPKMANYPKDSRQYKGLRAFNTQYTLMFTQLQEFYDSQKGQGDQFISASISSMNNMAGYVMPLLTSSPPVCPSFEWIEGVQLS